MRIISGSARGRRLTGPAGKTIRPTPDRVREALFSSLYSRLGSFEGMRVLDLFAGTGALSLEALSRGAQRAVLVDRDRQSVKVIAANIAACAMNERAALSRGEVLEVLPRLTGEAPFDLVFLDPPYGLDLAPKVIAAIDDLALLAPGGIICAEAARGDALPEAIGNLHREDRRIYGSTAVHLYRSREDEAAKA